MSEHAWAECGFNRRCRACGTMWHWGTNPAPSVPCVGQPEGQAMTKVLSEREVFDIVATRGNHDAAIRELGQTAEALRSELAEAITLLSDIDACLGGADPFSNPEWSWQRSMNKAAADIRAFLARTAEVK